MLAAKRLDIFDQGNTRRARPSHPGQFNSRARDVEVPMFAVTSIPLVAGWPSRVTVFGRVGPLFLHFFAFFA